ncbi:MAG: hypothetical protein AYK22_05040 [Thermoplasmatales archaeon SG8-52-3]|nr:MAG: hypothetical protein AYK22_05040 [Thermoplasmatales archaeon SG8-52-3]
MSWIKIIKPTEATGELMQIYKEIEEKRGKISNIMKIQSLNPNIMKNHIDLYINLMFGPSGLSREEREFIAVCVSIINNCEYCIKHHAESLNNYWKDGNKIEKFIEDFNSIEISLRLQNILDYVFKLTGNPSYLKENDIDNLRKSGFSDKDILDINLITSYFNFINRIALGLGVEFSSEEIKGYKN